jgi:hypothetical protein
MSREQEQGSEQESRTGEGNVAEKQNYRKEAENRRR